MEDAKKVWVEPIVNSVSILKNTLGAFPTGNEDGGRFGGFDGNVAS